MSSITNCAREFKKCSLRSALSILSRSQFFTFSSSFLHLILIVYRVCAVDSLRCCKEERKKLARYTRAMLQEETAIAGLVNFFTSSLHWPCRRRRARTRSYRERSARMPLSFRKESEALFFCVLPMNQRHHHRDSAKRDPLYRYCYCAVAA